MKNHKLTKIIVILAVIIGAYFIYQNHLAINVDPEIVQVNETFTATEAGSGVGVHATCPVGKQPTSGTCLSAGAATKFVSAGSELVKSNANLEHNDSWACYFTAIEPGTYSYTVSAICE